MRYTVFVLLLFGWVCAAHAQEPSSINNPVLDGVADSGVLKHNGEYYILGTGTSGKLYVSSNLVDWRGPEHVFSMSNAWTRGEAAKDHQIHACDLNYVNGTFHLYWSVNHWGDPKMTVRIGHATSSEVMGPYTEPVSETWFDSRIDAHLFVDDDGTPYFYSTKFADGNVVYGQKMDDPWTRIGRPQFLLSAHPGTWEARAERINEGAEVERYRDRYYMMYASNHVSARWGQYAIGVAEASHPLEFNNASKYEAPVIGPTNEDRITDQANVLLPIGTETWRYTTASPTGSGWTERTFDDSGWQEGRAAFGNQNYENSTTHRTHTKWEASDLWLRKTIHLSEMPSEYLQLWMRLHGTAEIYVNGTQIHQSDGVRNYATLDVGDTSPFRPGENVLAVHVKQEEGRTRYVDVGLLDPQTRPGEAYIFSPGQPNLVRGPNGFEWWLVYLGRFNGTGKSQAIDRVHFFDRTLHVDGPTAERTPGYHPPPRAPTFGDRFSEVDRTGLGEAWQPVDGEWQIQEGEAVQRSGTGTSTAAPRAPAGTHYLIQSGVRVGDQSGEAGIVAYQNESGDRLTVSLNPSQRVWTYRRQQDGAETERSFALPADFDGQAYHTLRVTKNGGTFHVSLDGRPAPRQPTIETNLSGRGRPGLMTRGTAAAFDGVTYTRGWDEHDEHITGWTSSRDAQEGWRVDSTGFHSPSSEGTHRVVKGEPLSAYEVSTQVYGDLTPRADGARERQMGFFPVLVDEGNFLRAAIDMNNHRLVVEKVKAGERENRWTVPLTRTKQLYQDPTHSDSFAKRYTFSSPTLVDSLRVKHPETGEISSIPTEWAPEYRREESWKSLPTEASMDPVLMDALRVDRGDEGVEIGTVLARVQAKSTYNLRAVKRSDAVLLFVDGEEVLRVPGEWPASRVGLGSRNIEAHFNGLQRFEIPSLP